MRIALVCTPLSDANLRLASQIGVTDIVGRFPGLNLNDMLALRDRITRFGMKLSVIEGYIPHDQIVLGAVGRDRQIEDFKTLLRHMGKADVPICCYNWVPNDEWARTGTRSPERGNAMVTSFDVDLIQSQSTPISPAISDEQLWDNLKVFLEQVLPTAEEAGVKLAMHPDDPPLLSLRGQRRIVHNLDAFERLVQLVPSPSNSICFCQGCFSEMGLDVPAAIRRLGPHISYVHFRDVRGCVPKFHETFHDTGQTNMFEAIRAYQEVGFDGPMRPDHVPVLEGESADLESTAPPPHDSEIAVDVNTYNGPDIPVPPGYTMLGRLYAVGYMRGLIHAVRGG